MTIDRRVIRTRTALYDALIALVRTKSYVAITVEDILRQANVGRSTFYAHFTSKDDLLERSLERLHALLTDALTNSAARQGPEDEAWDPCRTLFEHVQGYRDVQLALAGSGADAILRQAVDAVLARVLRPGVAAAPSPSIPDELAVRHIISTFHTVLGWWFGQRPEMSAAEADALFRQILLNPIPSSAWGRFISS